MGDGVLRVASLSDQGQDWTWVKERHVEPPAIAWSFYSAAPTMLAKLPGINWDRVRASLQLRRAVRRGAVDIVVSHSPRNSHYASVVSLGGRTGLPHLASSFNFTDLPTGYRLEAMRKSFARIDRFTVFTEMERRLYADVFGLPVERFHFARWGVAPPIAEPLPLPRTIAEPYVIAIGGEARDYATLCAAARRLADLRFVVVARPNSFAGLDVPANVTVLVNRPWIETWSLAAHALASLVPLRSGETPNGIVTIVGGMYLGKPQIVTDSLGVHDYLADGETGLLVPVQDDAAFAQAIERLRDDPTLAATLGANARAFACRYCTEQVSADFAVAQISALAAGIR